MDDNNGNIVQPTTTNQQSQNVQTAPASSVNQQPAQSAQFAEPSIQQPEITKPSGGEKPKTGKKVTLVVAVVLLILILVVGGVFVIKKYSKSNNKSIEEQQTLLSTPTINQQQTESDTTSPENGCDDFPSMLEACTKYTCEFAHPLTGEQMTREITGINNSKCIYSEEMPNGGKMNCEYTDEMRTAVANYHRDLVDAESFGTEFSAELGPEETEVSSTYTIDGKVVNNPLQEALDTGQCIVSGY